MPVKVVRHLTDEKLSVAVAKADDPKVVRRLCFVGNLYTGDTLKEATSRVGASRSIGSQWLERWNDNGPDGLIPRFGGGRPPKFSHQQSRDLQRLLEDGQPWTSNEVVELIEDEFDVSYHPGHVSRILRHTYGMSYAIPRIETPSRPDNAEEILAERLTDALGEIDADRTSEAADPGETVRDSFDESWPMPTDNKHRLWGFATPRLVKNMPDVKTTAAGFYAVNGTSVLRSLESLEQERIGKMFEAIREQNPRGRILLVLDNFSRSSVV